MRSYTRIKNVVIAQLNPCGQLLGRRDLPEGLITLSKHARFGGAVSFHEHRSETCDVTMRFAVYAPPRRVLDPAVAQEEQRRQPMASLSATPRRRYSAVERTTTVPQPG